LKTIKIKILRKNIKSIFIKVFYKNRENEEERRRNGIDSMYEKCSFDNMDE